MTTQGNENNPSTDAVENAVENAGQAADLAEISLTPPLRADSSLATGVAAFDEYMVRKGFSINTIKAFRNDLKITVGYLGSETPLHQITTQNLEEYLHWLQNERGRPCATKTLARRITTLKVFFSWLHGIGVLGTDPAEPIAQQPTKTPLPTILREDEVARLSRAAQDYLWDRPKSDARPFLLVNLLLQTGIKKAECARLVIEDIDISNPNSPQAQIRYNDERHAHKNRTIALHSSIVPALNQYLEQYEPKVHLFECTPRNLEYVLDEVGERARIKSVKVGFEALRWTAAVRDFRTGTSEEQLRQKMGLSKISWRETREKIYQLAGR